VAGWLVNQFQGDFKDNLQRQAIVQCKTPRLLNHNKQHYAEVKCKEMFVKKNPMQKPVTYTQTKSNETKAK